MDPRLPRNGEVERAQNGKSEVNGIQHHDQHVELGEGSCAAGANGTKPIVARQVRALDVYEDAVQEPLLECNNLAGMYFGAQEIGSTRPDARLLREDFCSSAIVAQTWLQLDEQNRAQGVDIDLDALKVARRRMNRSGRLDRRAAIVQSADYASTSTAQLLAEDDDEGGSSQETTAETAHAMQQNGLNQSPDDNGASSSTWAAGAASDRFERKFQARLAREAAKKERSHASTTNGKASGDDGHLLLLHADVLSMPMAGAPIDIEPPDLVYAGNYALSYFHDRQSLLKYLRQCRSTLRKHTGVLIVDPFAGPTTWEASTDAEKQEQKLLWTQFGKEQGFLRSDDGRDPPSSLQGHPLEFWHPPTSKQSNAALPGSADWRNWPRGRLVLVRKGVVRNTVTNDLEDYEYWREDGPLDYATNRFRMSLSFRFVRDGSWLRDYFSYDFRVWSLKEITEAMEEVGFARVAVHAIPRTTEADAKSNASSRRSSLSSASSRDCNAKDDVEEDEDAGLDGMASLMRRTERHERDKSTYQVLEAGQKLFASKSFGTYVIACMPLDDS